MSGKSMQAILAAQKQANLTHGPLSAAERADWLNRLIALLADHKDEIADTISRDFGNRTRTLSLLADVLASIGSLGYARDNLETWMVPEAHEGMFPDAEARVEYVPLGVVGMLSPWNFPVNLTFAPLAGIVAAGNRCMIKPSELTPATSDMMARLIGGAFDESEIAVVLGGPDVAAEFTSLPFDHLLYTGSTAVARHVMRAAADNLVPVTLELGGKSPVIISETAQIGDAAARIMTIKTLNAGQICLAPDYVLLPEDKIEPFVASARQAVGTMFPSLVNNPDYTAIINEKHHARLRAYLDDAQANGAELVEINPAHESFEGQNVHRMPPTLVLKPSQDSRIMKEEIFGPVLTYRNIGEAIAFVNSRPRPLALYYFGQDAAEEQRVITQTISGGVTVNDVMTHAFSETIPFGGVGESGMGAYHGQAGFRTFSHARAIYRQSKSVEAEYALRPPYGEPMRQYLESAITR
jgi:coniferyl-aldehyde dehydrogenase